MATSVIMPKAGMAMETGTILRWLKNVGDTVAAGEPLVEIQTDKVAMEIEAEVSGVLTEILHREGDEVPVTTPIAVIGEAGEYARAAAEEAAAPAEAVRPLPSPGGRGVKATPAARRRAAELGAALESFTASGTSGEIKLRDVETGAGASRSVVSPLARRIAEQSGVDTASLAGSGPGGRVVRRDVEHALEAAATRAAAAPSGLPGAATRVALQGARKAIARRMLQSHLSVPQVTLDARADVTSLLRLRERLNAQTDLRISVNDLLMKAAAAALVQSPFILRTVDGDDLVEFHEINIGMAVALETGLLVPVIRGAEKLSLSALARQADDLAKRAREKRLKPDEMAGGTFTVTNLGMYGITSFTPLVNPPQGAILGVNAAVPEVRLESGQPVERRIMTLSLSIDHRAIDGAQGALFLQRLVSLLENPYRILV